MVYLLVSLAHRLRLRLKVRLRGDDPHVATVSGVWPAANWLEREVWDLFGIVFDGHPDLRRLLMPEDWEGLSAAQGLPGADPDDAADASEPLQVTEEEFRANLDEGPAARGVTDGRRRCALSSGRWPTRSRCTERMRRPIAQPVLGAAADDRRRRCSAGGKLLVFGNGGSAADAQHCRGGAGRAVRARARRRWRRSR